MKSLLTRLLMLEMQILPKRPMVSFIYSNDEAFVGAICADFDEVEVFRSLAEAEKKYPNHGPDLSSFSKDSAEQNARNLLAIIKRVNEKGVENEILYSQD